MVLPANMRPWMASFAFCAEAMSANCTYACKWDTPRQSTAAHGQHQQQQQGISKQAHRPAWLQRAQRRPHTCSRPSITHTHLAVVLGAYDQCSSSARRWARHLHVHHHAVLAALLVQVTYDLAAAPQHARAATAASAQHARATGTAAGDDGRGQGAQAWRRRAGADAGMHPGVSRRGDTDMRGRRAAAETAVAQGGVRHPARTARPASGRQGSRRLQHGTRRALGRQAGCGRRRGTHACRGKRAALLAGAHADSTARWRRQAHSNNGGRVSKVAAGPTQCSTPKHRNQRTNAATPAMCNNATSTQAQTQQHTAAQHQRQQGQAAGQASRRQPVRQACQVARASKLPPPAATQITSALLLAAAQRCILTPLTRRPSNSRGHAAQNRRCVAAALSRAGTHDAATAAAQPATRHA